jgi:hypothetical protein
MWQNSSPLTKFLGNSLDVNTRGRSHVYFPAHNDHFSFSNPHTRVHNIILGKFWYEHYGELHIVHPKSGMTCTVTFKKAGLFQGTQYDVDGYVRDGQGEKLIRVTGAWNARVALEWLRDCKEARKGERREILRVVPTFIEPYNMPAFSARLNVSDAVMRRYLLPSDARRRPDRAHLERGDADKATLWKKRLEEQQRAERKSRTPETPWIPLWFAKVSECNPSQKARWQVPGDTLDEGELWVYVGDYWEQRDKRLSVIDVDKTKTNQLRHSDYYPLHDSKKDNDDNNNDDDDNHDDGDKDLPLRPRALKGTAADFLKFELEELRVLVVEEDEREREHSDEPRTAATDTSASEASQSKEEGVKLSRQSSKRSRSSQRSFEDSSLDRSREVSEENSKETSKEKNKERSKEKTKGSKVAKNTTASS